MGMRQFFGSMMLACSLVACSSEGNYAPVMDIETIEHVPQSGVYRVLPNETLYSIAWRYGLDYRYIANLNHINPPYHIVAGQRIYLTSKSIRIHSAQRPQRAPLSSKVVQHATPVFVEHEANAPVKSWRWPAKGSVTGFYSTLNKGINISGNFGDPIFATASGLVVYSGNGLRGYGNLIIIKHNSNYLSAYAHNSRVLVKEGQWVRSGQEIAEMGNTGTQRVILHFEIRRSGQPVNPLNYLV